MSKENKKYYWLKLEKDFFKRHDIAIIENMQNGKDYILFYLKLLLESINHNGELRFSETIPYNDEMLSVITNTNVDIVRSAIKMFTELHLMEVWDDKTIYIQETQKMVGSETEWAKKKREYRKNKPLELINTDKKETKKDNVLQEKEIELDKELDKDTINTYGQNDLTEHSTKNDFNINESFNLFWKKYNKKVKKQESYNKFKLHVNDADTFRVLMNDLSKRTFTNDWIKQDGQFRPYPSTYLNGKMWTDEYETDIDGFDENLLIKCDEEAILNTLSNTMTNCGVTESDVKELVGLLDNGLKTTKDFTEELKARIVIGGSE